MGLNVPTGLSFAAHPFAQQAKYQFFTPSITHSKIHDFKARIFCIGKEVTDTHLLCMERTRAGGGFGAVQYAAWRALAALTFSFNNMN